MTSRESGGSSRKPTNGGRQPEQRSSVPEQAAIDVRLRELHDSFADDETVPDHLIDLARRINDAYERLNSDQDGAASAEEEERDPDPSNDGGWT